MGDRIHIHALPAPGDPEASLMLREIFRQPGVYFVEPMLKATIAAEAAETFEAWFLRRLEEAARLRAGVLNETIWTLLEQLLRKRGVRAPSELDFWELRQTLFDLSNASTAHMVGFRLPPALATRLEGLGFPPAEALDFPALAYRMGRVYDRLQADGPVQWSDLVREARSFPLSPAEQAAVDVARSRAGVWMRPIFDEAGNVWTAERELAPLREIVGDALEFRRGARKAIRDLGASQRAMGVHRDASRVIRTELANAAGEGNWKVRNWSPEQRIYRLTTPNACRDCLRIYKEPNGMPRIYTAAEVEAESAKGPNTGKRETWGPRIGSTHVNCCCPPWIAYHEAMRGLLERRAPEFAQLMERLKVYPEAA